MSEAQREERTAPAEAAAIATMLPQHLGVRRQIHRLEEAEALQQVAAQALEAQGLLGSLAALGDDCQLQAFADVDDGAERARAQAHALDITHEGAVDLQDVEGQGLGIEMLE